MAKQGWIKTYLVDIMPLIAILLYVLAIIYDLAFFSAFDINVLRYISLTETLINIIEPLLLFAPLILISVGIIILFLREGSYPTLPKPNTIYKKFKNCSITIKKIVVIPFIFFYIIDVVLYMIAKIPEWWLIWVFEDDDFP